MNIVKPVFKIADNVVIQCSKERGVVIGVAEYDYMDPQYLIRYQSQTGCAVECWWDGGALALLGSECVR